MPKKRARAIAIGQRLDQLYPQAQCSLHFQDAFTLTICVLLSAQTTDAAVNKVTPVLFQRWPDATALAGADPAEVAMVLRSIGLYKSKATRAVQCAQMIVADFGGEVPTTMAELTRLPGVGRKTANIILNDAFGIVVGIAVDTHVFRIAHRLGFSPESSDTPAKVEADLLKVFPEEFWSRLNHQWVWFGREYCRARQARCPDCSLHDLCPSNRVESNRLQ